MRRPLPLATALVWGLSLAAMARAAGPADPLFRLVPPDAGVAVAVENLRENTREIGESPLADGLRRLQAVKAWLGSSQIRDVRRLVGQIEETLGEPQGTIRDGLFGDAVVLALRPGPAEAPEQSRGLLLARARDRAMLDRMIDALNKSQTDSGELTGVARKAHGTGSYMARTYSRADRPEDFYKVFDDGVFAWSNSDGLLREVLDRKAEGGACLADDPGFREVRTRLPERALVSLYVSPRLIVEGLKADERKKDATEERVAGLFARYAGALTYTGAAIEWRDGISFHSHEAIDPSKLDGWLRDWLTRPSSGGVSVGPLPPTAIAAAALEIDFVAARDGIWTLVPESERPWYHDLKVALQGLLLGQDLDASILPRLGPGILAYLDAPVAGAGRPRLPITGVIGVKPGPDSPGPGAAIENAIRTGVAIVALDRSRKGVKLEAETRAIGEAQALVISSAGRAILAFSPGRDRLIIGNSPEAIARFGHAPSPSPLETIRAEYFPDARSFAVVDLANLARLVKGLREPIAERLAARGKRPRAEVARDLDQMVAAADLFRAAAFTSVADPDAKSIHRVLRLIAR